MRIITYLLVLVILALSVCIWNNAADLRLLNDRIRKAKAEIAATTLETKSLAEYKNESSLPLDKFYLSVFSDIKEISSYCHADYEIKLLEGRDFVNTRDFFKESSYRGIRYVDLICQIDSGEELDTYIFDMLYKLAKSKPIEILEAKIEKNTLNLTLRLYGP